MRVAVDHREAILEAAARLFGRRPYHEVLMDEVADKVGVAKGTLYRYFTTKEELFAAVSIFYIEKIGVELKNVGGDGPSAKPPLERLRDRVVRLIQLLEEHKSFFQVMQRHELEIWTLRKTEFLKRRAENRDLFAALIEEAQSRGEAKLPFPAATVSDMLFGMIRNALRFAEPRVAPEQLADMTLTLLLHGIGSRREPKG
jgi:AcrR family transcriptional regulator